MRVWIVADNNNKIETIIPFSNLEAAEIYMAQYPKDSLEVEDCWIIDGHGTEVRD